jgi:hypothetical protein
LNEGGAVKNDGAVFFFLRAGIRIWPRILPQQSSDEDDWRLLIIELLLLDIFPAVEVRR